MLTGCIRTATLGVATVLNPITGRHGFASELTTPVDNSQHAAIRYACAAALIVFGCVCTFLFNVDASAPQTP